MKNAKRYEVIIDTGNGYSRLEHRNRIEWKTKKTAEKHAREFKAIHVQDAWAQEV